MKRLNSKGFALIEGVLIFVVVALIAGVGYYVYNASQNNPENAKSDGQRAVEEGSSESDAEAEDEIKATENTTYKSFSVSTTKTLKDKGSCKTGEVLFAPIYNSDSFDYDCSGLKEALDYAVIVYGKSSKSVLDLFNARDLVTTDVTVANEVKAKKHVFLDERKGHGTLEYHDERFALYQVSSKDGQFFYGIYRTGIGYSDEDEFTKAFNEQVLDNWELK